jgi:pantoate ligase/cytidylate kinase
MGALHIGHLSLIQRSVRDCDATVVSIFVNPLQFGPKEDFSCYPRQLDTDRKLCQTAGVDILFLPQADEFLGVSVGLPLTTVVPPVTALNHLCGPWRPGHFEGVLTIVAKLLNAVQPWRAYFGQKDAQQLVLIRRMAQDLNIPVEIIGCPTVRESDGLALSSRNLYLSPQERPIAALLWQGLSQAEQMFAAGERDGTTLLAAARATYGAQPGLQVQYLELVDAETLQPIATVAERGLLAVAAVVGQTRLIDNVLLQARKLAIAIDGPAGAGKSTVARQVATQLHLLYLDTGALYRALTWWALEQRVDLTDAPTLADLAATIDIRLQPSATPERPLQVWVGDVEVTQAIRSPEVTANVSTVAAQPHVRQELLKLQRRLGSGGGIVMEGRDIGTQVLPDAELKIFLTASARERARRRLQDLHGVGAIVALEELEGQLRDRDRKDSERAASPLRQADDAIAIDTDSLTQAEVVAKIVALYRELL